MKVSDLKKGDTIYFIEGFRCRRVTYFCPNISLPEKYHIVVNESGEPERVYIETLQRWLDQGLQNYGDVRIEYVLQAVNSAISFAHGNVDFKNKLTYILMASVEKLNEKW